MGGRESAGTGPHRADWDFFVSYTRADRKWAEWISWQLEASGYRVLVQAWDMVPGSHWPASMQDGIQYSQRTVAVVSSAYLSSVFGEAEWEAAWLDDPRGFKRKLIPVRVEDCPRPGLLGQVVSIDLFNLGMQEARELLLDKIAAVKVGREKPAEEPEFPGTHVPEVSRPSAPPAFPGSPGRAAGLVASSASPGIRASRGRAQWHASIETAEGDTKGSGILVSARTVLTCARVVDGLDDVRVTFPGVPGVAGLPARVIDLHSRAESGGRGDVALVELANSAPVEPCVLSGLDTLRLRPDRASRELRVLGFPLHHAHDGIPVRLRAGSERGLGGEERLQVDVEQAHLEGPGRGFSGAGTWIAGSGQVVGMITDVVLRDDGQGLTGQMLPLGTIRRHWEGIDDFLTLPWMDPEPRRELRAAVAGATTTTGLDKIFRMVFPAFLRTPELRTAWAAIRYVAEDVPGDDSLRFFLSRLASFLDGGARSRLTEWTRRWLPSATDELGRVQAPVTSIVIMLRTPTRNGKTHLELTARPMVEGRWGAEPQKLAVRRDQVQAKTEKVITAQVSQLRDPDWMIEFAVQPGEMGLPFEEWQFHEPGVKRARPMRSVPLVVWDVSRLNPQRKFVSSRARQRWRTLRARGKTSLMPVCCPMTYDFEEFRDWLDADTELCALAYGVPPKREWLEAALDTGIPIMVWSRRDWPSGSEAHDTHEEFLCRITAALSAADPDQLPTEVMRLRKQARSPVIGDERHPGRHLTLFWDHPALLADAPLTEGG